MIQPPAASLDRVTRSLLLGMARPGRFELPTLCLEGRRSIQLSYGRFFDFKRFAALGLVICYVLTPLGFPRIRVVLVAYH